MDNICYFNRCCLLYNLLRLKREKPMKQRPYVTICGHCEKPVHRNDKESCGYCNCTIHRFCSNCKHAGNLPGIRSPNIKPKWHYSLPSNPIPQPVIPLPPNIPWKEQRYPGPFESPFRCDINQSNGPNLKYEIYHNPRAE